MKSRSVVSVLLLGENRDVVRFQVASRLTYPSISESATRVTIDKATRKATNFSRLTNLTMRS